MSLTGAYMAEESSKQGEKENRVPRKQAHCMAYFSTSLSVQHILEGL